MSSTVVTTENAQDSDTKSKAKADAITIRSIVGRLRYAWELATGAQAIDGDGYGTPRNPSGDYGCNASGPPWGRTFLAPYAIKGGMQPDTTNWLGQKQVIHELKSPDGEPFSLFVPIRCWVQGYELGTIDGTFPLPPLSRLYPVITMRTLAGGPINVTVTAVSAQWVSRSVTFSVTNTSEETFEDAELWIDTQPGAVVPARLKFETSDNTNGIAVDRISLNCISEIGYASP